MCKREAFIVFLPFTPIHFKSVFSLIYSLWSAPCFKINFFRPVCVSLVIADEPIVISALRTIKIRLTSHQVFRFHLADLSSHSLRWKSKRFDTRQNRHLLKWTDDKRFVSIDKQNSFTRPWVSKRAKLNIKIAFIKRETVSHTITDDPTFPLYSCLLFGRRARLTIASNSPVHLRSSCSDSLVIQRCNYNHFDVAQAFTWANKCNRLEKETI